jgi:mannose-6-phosphate isomerase-like protein (cupin superfamily)
VPFEHVHPYQEERFDVLSGTARVSMRGQERDVGVGETVVVPAGTPHVWGTRAKRSCTLSPNSGRR